ncbi:MAG: stage II sporulation protein M [Clostridia bacterium]
MHNSYTYIYYRDILGVFFVNNMQESPKEEIQTYIDNFIEKMKSLQNIDNATLLKNSIIQNAIFAILIWFFGTTVIGLPIVFGLVLYRGFCLGYTISSFITILGIGKGITFLLASLLFQSLLTIPAILGLAVSGFKLYKSIIKRQSKRKYKILGNSKTYNIFTTMIAILLLASVVEIFISTNSMKILVKYL